jgi:hypothetical protein
MVKLQGFTALIVTATAASTTQEIDCHLSYFLAPFFDSFNQILAAISICPFVLPPDRALLHSRMLYQLSY